MCGRFAFFSAREAMPGIFGVDEAPPVEMRYNIAPTQDVAVIRVVGEERRMDMLRWGLIPFWSRDEKIGNRLINARAETADEKPAFRTAWRKRRCLIPADGFYEWRKEAGGKVPYFVSAASGQPFAMAGLWERWEPKSGGEDGAIETFTILTTAPTDFMLRLHDRMPVILSPETSARWLAAAELPADGDSCSDPAVELRAWPVSRRVNSPANEGPSLVEPEGDTLENN